MTTTITVTAIPSTVSVVNMCAGNVCASYDSRYLITSEGKVPILLIGDSSWELMSQATDEEWDIYFANRKAKGFNFCVFTLIEHYFCTNAPNDIYDNAPFTGANFTTPNETYFARVDALIDKASDYGFICAILPVNLGYAGTEEGWDTEIAAASNADMASWGTYVGSRYKDFPNIIWVIGGDQDPTAFLTKLDYFTDALVAEDPNHLITGNSARNHNGSEYFSGYSWFALNSEYCGKLNVSSLANSAWSVSPTIPFFNFENIYEGASGGLTATELRSELYWLLLAGGCGVFFGNATVWAFGYGGGNWQAAMELQGSYDTSRLITFFNSKAWHTLIPDSAHTHLTVGYGTIDTANYAGAAFDTTGNLGLIYMPSNRTMTVDMSHFSGTVNCRWFDPTDGSYVDDAASPHANSGTHDFSRATVNSDGEADWILVLET